LPDYRRWVHFAKDLWREIFDDCILDGAAVLAFFFLLAVFPAAIFVLSLLPTLSIPHLQQAMLDLLHQVLPDQSANFFEAPIRYVASERKGLLTFGLIVTLWSGSSGVYAVMEQLNAVGDIRDRRPFWKARGTSILLMLFFALLGIGSLGLVILGGVVQSWLASMVGWSQALRVFFATLRWIILAAALLLALAVAYRFGPDGKPRFRYLSPGNAAAAVLIALASVAFRVYVSKFGNYSATYGSLAAIIILMLWMYMAGIALLVGGEINSILQPHTSIDSG
jgi:membrane protein